MKMRSSDGEPRRRGRCEGVQFPSETKTVEDRAWPVKSRTTTRRYGRMGNAESLSFEVEIKFRVADHDDLRRRLIAMGGVPGADVEQEDLYLAHPSRDFV